MVTVELAETAVEDFRAELQGELLHQGHPDYDAARRVYNVMIDKRPALIVRCRGVADVIAAVNFARTHDALVAVRCGGHNVAGSSTCDGGLVIDLSPMKGIRVDPVRRTVRAEGGVTWGELDRETQVFGLATTGGVFSTTGIGGLTLGGGIGYLNRKHGLSCDNLLSADVVTADGRVLVASAAENDDLFWALRGGGGNFGVVTSFEYRLHPVGPVLAGMLVHPLDRAKEALRFYRDFAATAPDEVRVDASLGTSPDGPGLAIVVCYCGSVEEGERVLRPLRQFGPPVEDTIAPVPYKTIQTLLEAVIPPGYCHYWKSSFLRELSDDAISTAVDSFPTVSSPQSLVIIEHLGGAISRVGEQDTAYSHRYARYTFLVASIWADPAESAKHIEWARNLWGATQPFLDDAVYVNYLGEGEGETRVRAAYGANYERLVALKSKYDPNNLFRLNQNIRPAT